MSNNKIVATMRRFILILSMILLPLLPLMAQVDQKSLQLPSKIYSSEVLVGDWVTEEYGKYVIKLEDNKLYIKKKKSGWQELVKSGKDVYQTKEGDQLIYEVRILNENELEISDKDYTFMNSPLVLTAKRKVDGQIVGDEAKSAKSMEDKKAFVSYYPALTSPIGIYAGLLNKKFNFYAGITLSGEQFSGDFSEGSCDGDLYLDRSGNPDATGLYTGDEAESQATFAIGLSNEIFRKKLRVHYGIGVGKYEKYRGFDLWNRNSDGDWNYEKTVWAKDESTLVEGVYLEGGFMYDLGILISLGFGTIQFERHDLKIGIGYAF